MCAFCAALAVIFGSLFWRNGMIGSAVLLIGTMLFVAAAGISVFGDRRPLLELTDEGILLERCKVSAIAWQDIDRVYIEHWPRAGRFLVIRLKDDNDRLTERCSYARTRHRDGRREFVLIAEGLDVPPGVLVNKINERLRPLDETIHN